MGPAQTALDERKRTLVTARTPTAAPAGVSIRWVAWPGRYPAGGVTVSACQLWPSALTWNRSAGPALGYPSQTGLWIDPSIGLAKAARLVRPGSWLALLTTGERYPSRFGRGCGIHGSDTAARP